MRTCCAALQSTLGLVEPAATAALDASSVRGGESRDSAEAVQHDDLGTRPTEDTRDVAGRDRPVEALADVLRQPSQALLEGARQSRPPACPFAAGQLERPALHLGQRRVITRSEALEQHHPPVTRSGANRALRHFLLWHSLQCAP